VRDKNKDDCTGWIQVLWCGIRVNAEARSQAEARAEPFSPGRASLRAIATMAIFLGELPWQSSAANPGGGMIFDGSTVENRFERR